MNFYDLIDTYATLHKIDRSEVLHLWYRGSIDATSLLAACLEDEGILGYTESLISIIRVLGFQSIRDGFGNPWTLEVQHEEE